MPGNFCSGRRRQLLSGHGRRQAAGKLTIHGLEGRESPSSDSARQKIQWESEKPTSNSQVQIRKQFQPDPAPPPWVSRGPNSNSAPTQKTVESLILKILAARRNGPRTLTTPPGLATPTHSGTRSCGRKAGLQASTWAPRMPLTPNTTAQRMPPTSAPC